MEEIEEIERREEKKKETREIVKDLMDEIMEKAARKLLLNETWNMLKSDDCMREAILIRMRMAEEWKARDAELSRMSLSLSTSNVASMTTVDKLTSPPPPNWELEATSELDQLSKEQLEHTGEVETVQSKHTVHNTHSTDVQWEELANLELEMFSMRGRWRRTLSVGRR